MYISLSNNDIGKIPNLLTVSSEHNALPILWARSDSAVTVKEISVISSKRSVRKVFSAVLDCYGSGLKDM